MNKKNISIIIGYVILSILLIITTNTLFQLQTDFRIMNNFIGYTIHVLSINNYEKGYDAFDLKELVVGKEKGFCESVDGFWNEQTRECLKINEKYCRLITGGMEINNETNEMGNCIIK